MKLKEIKDLNRILQNKDPKRNKKNSIYVDNLHTSFLEFEESYLLPSTSVFEVEYPAAEKFLRAVMDLAPEMISDCLVLPEPRPKRDIDRLFLIRPFYTEGEILPENSARYWLERPPNYAIVTSFFLMHLGGAEKSDIQANSFQGKTMSVYSKRIYFSTRVVPIDSLVLEENTLVDFRPRKYEESDFMVQIASDAFEGVRHTYSEIFDEVDYSKQVQVIRETIGIRPEDWTLGKIFEPIAVEYLTLTARFLEASLGNIVNDFVSFHQVVDLLLRPDSMTLEESSRASFFRWLRSHKAERLLSPSGNMVWRILREQRT